MVLKSVVYELIGKQEGVQEWFDPVLELLPGESLQGRHDVGGQCHGSCLG